MSIQKMSIQRVLKKDEGFTLVELLIVIAIIAILAAIAIPQFTQYRNRAFVTQLDSDAKNSYTAAQAWLTDNPGGVVAGTLQLTAGGFNLTPGITIPVAGNMGLAAGSFQLSSANVQAPDVATRTINFNGSIVSP